MSQDWEEIRRTARTSTRRAPEWPANVRTLPLDAVDLLGIDDENQLYWDGKQIEMRRSLDLTTTQTVIALIAAIGVLIGAIATVPQGIDAGCNLRWWSCPSRDEPAVVPRPAPAPPHLVPGTNLQPQ